MRDDLERPCAPDAAGYRLTPIDGFSERCEGCSLSHVKHYHKPQIARSAKSDGFMRVGDSVDHPAHYGGDTPYECIKVIEAWGLGFCLGSALKYISRAGKKPGVDAVEDLSKAIWYLRWEAGRRQREVSNG